MGRQIARRVEAKGVPEGLDRFSLLVLSGATTDLLAEGFAAAAARHGLYLQVTLGGFDQVEQDALDPTGIVARTRPDATVLALDHRWLRLDRPALQDASSSVERALERVKGVIAGLAANGGGVPILCTAPTPPEDLFGSFDRRSVGSVRSLIGAFNAALIALADETGALLLDVASLAERLGTDAWFDPVAWHGAKLAFAPCFDAAYAEMLGRLLGAGRGRARKALVLDLDNTIWGGVVGDDGLDALMLGPGSGRGEAFAAVQEHALQLHLRGVFLAVSSKNDEATARQAFAAHPGMILKPDHIAVFQANWRNKADNLTAIAEALNIGTDALVFLDDNPAERAQMRAALPQVAVPELPDDPALYVRTLAAAGYFETTAFSGEDAARAADAGAQARRVEVRASSVDVGDYLAGLQMELTLSPFDAAGRARIVQLINKTNQFNLTTRRRTEREVAELETDPAVVTMQARLRDRFGDLGMIAVLIAKVVGDAEEPTLAIDSWLMSCRVLGRGVEDAMFGYLLSLAAGRGATQILARYEPTQKNAPVADLLPRLGFEPMPPQDTGEAYRRQVALPYKPNPAIRVTAEPLG